MVVGEILFFQTFGYFWPPAIEELKHVKVCISVAMTLVAIFFLICLAHAKRLAGSGE
jgi:hypothetical protein